MTQGVIGSWLNAAQVSTLKDLELMQEARNLLSQLPGLDSRVVEQLQSGSYDEVFQGLQALRHNGALLRTLEGSLDTEAAQALVAQAAELARPVGGARDRFVPENPAARQSKNVLEYFSSRTRQVGGSRSLLLSVSRLIAENLAGRDGVAGALGQVGQKVIGTPQPRPETSKYDYDPERIRGHHFVHPEAPMAAMSVEGRDQWLQTHHDELEQLRDYVSRQLSLSSAEVQTAYRGIRSQVIAQNRPLQAQWDRVALAMRGLGNMPNFQLVSDAYWKRDEAIRGNEALRQRGIGPWEYDLYRSRIRFQLAELAGNATHRDRIKHHGGELAYALRGICAEYRKVESEPASPFRDARMKDLEKERFRLERAFIGLAKNESISTEDANFLDDIRRRYLTFLSELSDCNTAEIERLERNAQAVYDDYSRRLHERHVALAPMMHDLFMEEQKRIYEIDRLEEQWQVARYRGLIEQSNVSKRDRKRFEEALAEYTGAFAQYHAFAEGLIQGKPNMKEFQRNSKYREVFTSFWNLHDTVKAILGENSLEMLTFAFKTQAKFIARGPQGIVGLEPIAEITGRVAEYLDRAEKTIYSLPELYQLAGRDWSLNQLSHYARNVHIVGAQKLLGYFAQDLRPETMMLEGGAEMYPQGYGKLTSRDFAHRSGVRRALHLGQLEFSEAMGVFYQLGLGHVAILAQAGVRNFKTAGPFLYGLDRPLPEGKTFHHLGSGALLDRSSGGADREAAFTREINLGMGNNDNVYDNGTRDFASPISSPYADFDRHPEAVHLPEYHGTRYNTGMSLKLSRDMGVPLMTVAYNIEKVYPGPEMPMPSAFGDNFKSKNPLNVAKKMAQSYGGFWSDHTMFRYHRPGEEDVVVAYGEVITPESQISERDLPGILPADVLSQFQSIEDEQKREKAMRWSATQLNTAAANFYERVAGYHADAGLYGSEAWLSNRGRNLFASHPRTLRVAGSAN